MDYIIVMSLTICISPSTCCHRMIQVHVCVPVFLSNFIISALVCNSPAPIIISTSEKEERFWWKETSK